jgi:hypothetical protein
MRYSFGNPYPTFFELILSFTGYLDLKLPRDVKKKLDDKRRERKVDHRELKTLLEKSIKQPLSTHLHDEDVEIVFSSFSDMLKKYTEVVASVSADGIRKDDLLPILWNGLFKPYLGSLLINLTKHKPGPNLVTLFIAEDRAVDVTLKWMEQNEPDWSEYLSSLTKDAKETFTDWKKGYRLPSSFSIFSLGCLACTESDGGIDWGRVRLLLLISRAIDEMKRDLSLSMFTDELRCYLWGASDKLDIEKSIRARQLLFLDKPAPEFLLVSELQHELKLKNKKNEGSKARFRHLLNQAKKLMPDGNYWFTWYEARWHLLSGDLATANDLYKKAFEACLFSAGENQERIIEEALPVAASLEKPDIVFLKDLKRMCITFGYDIPSISSDKFSNKASTLIEDWELDLWRRSFSGMFPKQGYFPEFKGYETSRKGPIVVDLPIKIKPDIKRPNKKITVGGVHGKKMPQLIWFLIEENYEAVEKLILEGKASVNVKSDAGDTPLQVALEILNVAYSKSLDDRFFNLISECPHTPEIINSRTQKLRLLPIVLAVETGRPDIVRKVLEMGADPNGRGQTDEQTPLNVCLKKIGQVKSPKLSTQKQMEIPETPEVLDSIRRHLNGLSGSTLTQQKALKERVQKDPLFIDIKNTICKLIEREVSEKMSLDKLREIARMLIEHGADVNAEHRSPIKGYTPLMLAVEQDERDLFDLMLSYGGDLTKQYTDFRTGNRVDCWDIAHYFRSNRVLESLDCVKHHFLLH